MGTHRCLRGSGQRGARGVPLHNAAVPLTCGFMGPYAAGQLHLASAAGAADPRRRGQPGNDGLLRSFAIHPVEAQPLDSARLTGSFPA